MRRSPEKLSFFAQLAWIARERGYKPGWAAWKYRERFDAWPVQRSVVPESPDDATRRWAKSRQIAYAKAMQKQAS